MGQAHAGSKTAGVVLAAALVAACARPPVVGPISTAPSEPRVAGALEWPVRGALVSPYRPPSRPSHAGVDLAAPPGSIVIAAEAGDVVYAGEIRGYEGVIAVHHAGDLTTVYAHLGELRVAEGKPVARGEPIATVGDGGYLHYEIRRAKQPIDPADLYAMGPSLGESAAEGTMAIPEEPSADVPLGAAPAPAPPSPRAEIPAPEPRVPEAPPPARESARGVLGGDVAGTDAEAAPAPSAGDGGVPVAYVVGANLFYVPAKLAYAGVGAVTGAFVLVLSQDVEVANRFWSQTVGGDYFVTGEHLSGERGVRFMGDDPS